MQSSACEPDACAVHDGSMEGLSAEAHVDKLRRVCIICMLMFRRVCIICVFRRVCISSMLMFRHVCIICMFRRVCASFACLDVCASFACLDVCASLACLDVRASLACLEVCASLAFEQAEGEGSGKKTAGNSTRAFDSTFTSPCVLLFRM